MKQKTKHLQSLLLLLILTVVSTATAWAETASPAEAGTYSTATNPGAAKKFIEVSTNAVFLYRDNDNHGGVGSDGLKATSTNMSGYVFYISSPMTLTGTIKHKASSESTKEATLYISTVTSAWFQELVDGTTNSAVISADPVLTAVGNKTQVSGVTSSGETFDITYGSTLPAGYYYVYAQASGSSPSTNMYLKSITLTSSAPEEPYTVTFNANGHGTIDSNATKDLTEESAGAGVTPPTVVAADGYTLAGTWHTGATCTEANKVTLSDGKYMPSDDITLFAGYKYKVTFDAATNGGTCGTSDLTQASAGASITLPAATKTGYNFNGWYTESTSGTNRGTSSYVPTDNEALYAQFTAKTYTITLNANGGDANKSTTATYNSSTLTSWTAPTKSDNTLTGYYTAANSDTKVINADGTLVANVDGYTDVSGNWTKDGTATLYAQWAAVPSGYTITYDVDGRASAISSEAGVTALPASLPSVSPNAGYNFTGWFTDEERTEAAVAGAAITGNTTLYANYQIIGSISSSPLAGSTVKAGDPVYTTATTSASGVTQMRIAQGGGKYDAEILKSSGNLVGITSAGWGVSGGATLGTNSWVLSALLTDGKYYSDVLTNTFSVGVATPSISCSGNTVTITSATTLANTNIYYTLDGSTEPTSSSTLYSGPFAITETKTVKAIAINGGNSSAVFSQECVYSDVATSLPVTYDFNETKWASVDFKGASGKNLTLANMNTENNHSITFHGSNETEFSIVDDDPNYLHMTQNAATNHFIAIPISGINGRIDIKVWTTTTDSKFKIRGYLDTAHGTTVLTTSPGKPVELAVNAHTEGTKLFDFRMKDLSATNGVLYMGVNSSSFQNIEKITIETPAHMLEASPASVTMGDGETVTVSIKNHSAEYLPALGTVPSYVSAALNPSTGELVITPKAIGTDGSITLALDTNEDGVADDIDLEIPVTVQGVTINSSPTGAVYAYGAGATALSVSASQNDGGTLNYQWYRNTVNSTVGGTAISGATESTYTPSTTLAAEDASFYYCVVSSKSTSAPKTSGVAYVLTSSTGRYFHMSNVAGNKSTSETSIEVTGQKIAGGEVTYYMGADGKYVLRPDGYGHYYHLSSGAKFKVVLNKAIAAGDKISVKVQGLGDVTSRGIWVSASDSRPGSTPSAGVFVTAASETEVTKTYTAVADDGLVGASTIYIYGANNTADYFTDLIIYTPGDVKISAPTPAEQTVGKGITPSAISVTASDGTGNFSYQWQYSSNYTNDGNDANDTWNVVTTGTDYTTATFTPAASSPDVQTTTYYRCIVTDEGTSTPKKTATSGVASVTVEGVTRDYYKISTGSSDDATFTDGVYAIEHDALKSKYTAQNTAEPTRSYWKLNSSTPGQDASTYFEGSGTSTTLSVKSSRVNTSVFYVKGAAAVKFVGHMTEASRKYDVTIDGESMGTQTLKGTATECPVFALNKEGSVFEIRHNAGDVKFASFIFYEYLPSTITIKKDNETVTEATLYPPYSAEGAVDYAVESNSTGVITLDTSAEGYNTGIAEATYSNGILTVTPKAKGETTVTLNQAAADPYGASKVTFKVTVKKAEVTMAFSFNKVVVTADELGSTPDRTIPTAKLPTLTVTRADGTTNTATVNWQSDDANLISVKGSGNATPTYSLTYHSSAGQGGARIYAYVNEAGNYGAAVAYVDVVVQNGTSNNLPKGETIDVQEQFVLANDNGEEVVTLTYGGYKYNSHEYKYIDFKTLEEKERKGEHKDKWTSAASYNKYYIDGYQYNSNNENDAYNEYGYQLKGMTDDYSSGKCLDGMWYKDTETKPQGGNYGAYERIRPFALPCKGGYLKFEPKKSGVLTAYILQNGCIGRGSGKGDQIASKPRLGYWFDEDGWVQTNVTAVAKQPISNGNGTDKHSYTCNAAATATTPAEDGVTRNLRQQMDYYWTSTNGDADIIPMLTKPFCNAAKTTFSDTKETGYIDNPYYWGDDEHVINNNKQIIPTRMTPVPYHNGYLVPEQCYVKYTLPVIAGKSYYFYGMMTKIGYVGMNFVEDESVLTSGGNNIAHEKESTLHLKSDDDMGEYKFGGSSTALAQSTLFDEVTLPSNYKPNQWNTICLPFALSENQVEAAFGTGTQLAIYNGLEHSSTEHVYYVKYLRHVDQNILPGQPYLIYPTGTGVDQNDGLIGTVIGTAEGAPDNNKRITFNHVLIDKDKLKQAYASYGSNKDVDGGTGFIFTGTYTKIAMPQYSLFYSPVDGKLYRWTGTSTTPNFAAYHAYMHPNSSSVMQNGLVFSFSDDDITDLVDETGEGGQETGIVIVEEIGGSSNAKAQLKSNTKAYNLMGQEIDPRSAKGLVIVNGEKVMY